MPAQHHPTPVLLCSRGVPPTDLGRSTVPWGRGAQAGWVWPLLAGVLTSGPHLPAGPAPHPQSLPRQNCLQFPEGPAPEVSLWGCFTCCVFAVCRRLWVLASSAFPLRTAS